MFSFSSIFTGNKYDGGMKDDYQHGMGTYTYHQGHVYEGGYNMGKQNGRGKIVYHSGTIFEGQFKDSRIQYGLLRIATHEYVASFEETYPTTEDVDPMTIVYNVQLSSHDGKYFKPLQFCGGNFLDTEAVVVMRDDRAAGSSDEPRGSLEFVPLPLPMEEGDEKLIKIKPVHERPPPTTDEPPPKHNQFEDEEDMEDEQ